MEEIVDVGTLRHPLIIATKHDRDVKYLYQLEVRRADFDYLFRLWKCDLPFVKHISINRAWVLIQEAGSLSAAEAEHLETCSDCIEFLRGFVSVARYVGFSVRFPSQEHCVDNDHAA